jgi:hypothetical protein
LKKFFLEGELKDVFLIEKKHFSNYLNGLAMNAVDISKSDKKPFTKEEVNRQEFVKRNKVMYDFEKRMLKFLIREIPKAIGDKKDKLLIFKKLSADLATVFGSEYERSVLNYFDYENWINDKIKNLERFLKSSNN